MIHIDIISDTVCPWCYIGKRRLEKAIGLRPQARFQLGWRPFQLNPDMPPGGMDRERYMAMKFGSADGGRKAYHAIKEAGLDEALSFRFDLIERMPNTFDAHRLIRWAASAGCQDAVVETLFKAYFMDGREIGDQNVLLDVAGACGMDRDLVSDLFRKDADRNLVMAEEGVARRMGISGVPCFIVDRKYAVSGAQDPSVLLHVFDLAIRDQNLAAGGSDLPADNQVEGLSVAD
jgi:predicted DsbA family dithiol-disulfide isomerase